MSKGRPQASWLRQAEAYLKDMDMTGLASVHHTSVTQCYHTNHIQCYHATTDSSLSGFPLQAVTL